MAPVKHARRANVGDASQGQAIDMLQLQAAKPVVLHIRTSLKVKKLPAFLHIGSNLTAKEGLLFDSTHQGRGR